MRYAIPAVVLLLLIALFAVGLTRDPREVPSPLIGKAAPAFELAQLGDTRRLTPADFRGRPVLVNFFASWCAGCRVEHPLLLKLSQQGVEIIGIDYKDTDEDGARWLQQHGNPYRTVLTDPQGQAGLDWGVYGVPETFVLDAAGTIVYKQIGPMTSEAWAKIAPMLSSNEASVQGAGESQR